ncbi:lipocalin family protein [Sulfurirhabdus autotrophica]|uniref:Outer membrane lipoprotein Blc n=1 Tax=Sulfurirhabdus autotrophica TaxID=1706046 RepID=A0A4R3YF41_9PROT|nr:lipocalin family protein [Sulfurirhabdus autotrophica]TCV90581.1 apolipoprotein D and lipocalin family protein [Sulfurirhabdus autotrophica]
MKWFWLVLVIVLSGCSGVPEGLHPVSGFNINQYLGRWYEIARLDHSFERGLVNVMADYRKLPDGRVEVLNRGFSPVKNAWQDAKGVARFQGASDIGSLEVSFFWPFYGAYNVLVLDPAYRYAMVAGPNRGYLWILARESRLDQATLDRLVAKAKALGFATDSLIYVEQGPVSQQ